MKLLFVNMQPLETKSSAMIRCKLALQGCEELGHEVDYLSAEGKTESMYYDSTMNDLKSVVRNYYTFPINSNYEKLMKRKPDLSGVTQSNHKSNFLKSKFNMILNSVKAIYKYFSIFEPSKVNVKNVNKIKIDYSVYDYIISVSDPKSSHLIVKEIFKKNKKIKAKWIQYWGDPMYLDITRKNSLLDKIVKEKERSILKKANRIIYVSPFTLEKQMEEFKKESIKMFLSAQPSLYVNEQQVNDNNNINIGYAGAYYSKVRNILPFYNVAIKNQKNKDIKFNVIGSTDLSLKSINNISVKGGSNFKQANDFESQQDILIALCNISGTQIPAKIYYMSSQNKPIIVILDGESNQIRKYLETYNRFILCDNNEESIKAAIQKAIKEIGTNYKPLDKRLDPKYAASQILGNYKNNIIELENE